MNKWGMELNLKYWSTDRRHQIWSKSMCFSKNRDALPTKVMLCNWLTSLPT